MTLSKRSTGLQSMVRWLSRIRTQVISFLRYVFSKRGEKDMATEKVTFSSSNNAINTFFTTQKVNLPTKLYQDLLVFLSKACTYEEEERRVRPSLIIGHNLLDKQVKSIVQADIIVLAKDKVEKTHLSKRLKSMLPFCNNGWRVFINLDNEILTYGIMRNFNGPSGFSIDDILTNMPTVDKESLAVNFVLIDVASNFEILLKGNVDSCTIDFRLNDDNAEAETHARFCHDLLSAYKGDISRIATAYRKTVDLFPQKLHGSICLLIKHDHVLPDNILKDGIFLDAPIDIFPILAEDLNERQSNHTISHTIASHEKYHAYTGLLLEMLNIDGITIVDNKGRIRAYNVFVSPDVAGAENLSGGARKRAANYLKRQNNLGYIGVYFQSQDGMSTYERMESNE